MRHRSASAATISEAPVRVDPTTEPESQVSPNVLWVIVDQWRGQATGYAGDVNAVTPNLDRFAAEGLRFDSAFSAHPLCVPFRGALLTGQRAIHSGVTGHWS